MTNSITPKVAYIPLEYHMSVLIELIYEDKISPSEVRSTLREVVEEIGIGHTDEHLASVTIHRIRHNLGGKF